MFAFGCTLAVGIATLNHKVLNDTVKECAVIISLLCEFKDVVAMFRSFVVKAHNDVALWSFDFNLCHCYVY